MSSKFFRERLKADIESVQSQGVEVIPVVALLNYIRDMPDTNDARAMEEYRARWAQWVESHRLQHESNLEMFRSVITAGQAAIKTCFLLNGGSALAMLAFIGHLASVDQGKITSFAQTLIPFAFGVFIAALTSGVTYLSQWLFSGGDTAKKWGTGLNITAIVLGILSYLTFVWGIWWAYDAFTAY